MKAHALSAETIVTDDPWTHVNGILARSGTSFLWSMKVIAPERRRAMYAIYAFCREVDDIADTPGDVAPRMAALDAWREEIDRLYGGSPTMPTARALGPAVRRFELPREEFLAIIDGMETDLAGRVELAATDDLLTYCRRVAGAVGMLIIHVFGVSRHPGPVMAQTMGNAFQITNILRDLEDDAQQGRLYVPRDILAQHGIRDASPDDVLKHPAFAGVCAEMASMARRHYAEADCLLGEIGRRRIRPIVAMMKVYSEILDLLEQRGWTRLDVPVKPPKARLVWLAFRYGLL